MLASTSLEDNRLISSDRSDRHVCALCGSRYITDSGLSSEENSPVTFNIVRALTPSVMVGGLSNAKGIRNVNST
jgi:hypothetical protein